MAREEYGFFYKQRSGLNIFYIFDLDNFKLYNDVYGHRKGDDALIMFADLLKSGFKRASDFTFRLALLDKAWEHRQNKPLCLVTVSGGMVLISREDDRPFSEIYHLADESLYKAKDAGRNRIE